MPRKNTPHLSEALTEFMAVKGSHMARNSINNYRSVLTRFVAGVGDPRTHLLTSSMTEHWFVALVEEQQPASYNKLRTIVANFLEFCGRHGWLNHDPMADIRPRRVPKKERLRLSTQQLLAMIELTENPRDRGMIAMACNTGLRASDLTGLRVGDVDLGQGVVRVAVQKTGDLDWLPITSDLDTELRRWLAWYSERLARHGTPITPQGYLFCAMGWNNTRVGRVIEVYGDPRPDVRQQHAARVVQRALQRIGIYQTSHEGFHTIRRSVGRIVFDHAAEQGHDGALRLTAALLGHQSTQTTELYLGLSSDRVKRDQLLKGRSILNRPEADKVRAIR